MERDPECSRQPSPGFPEAWRQSLRPGTPAAWLPPFLKLVQPELRYCWPLRSNQRQNLRVTVIEPFCMSSANPIHTLISMPPRRDYGAHHKADMAQFPSDLPRLLQIWAWQCWDQEAADHLGEGRSRLPWILLFWIGTVCNERSVQGS